MQDRTVMKFGMLALQASIETARAAHAVLPFFNAASHHTWVKAALV